MSCRTLGRGNRDQIRMRGDVRANDLFGAGNRVGLSGSIHRVGFDQRLLAGGRRVGTVVNRGDWTRRNARAAIDTLVWVDVQHRGLLELRLVLPRMDAVHRAHIDARCIFRADAGIGDDERHSVELTQKRASL